MQKQKDENLRVFPKSTAVGYCIMERTVTCKLKQIFISFNSLRTQIMLNCVEAKKKTWCLPRQAYSVHVKENHQESSSAGMKMGGDEPGGDLEELSAVTAWWKGCSAPCIGYSECFVVEVCASFTLVLLPYSTYCKCYSYSCLDSRLMLPHQEVGTNSRESPTFAGLPVSILSAPFQLTSVYHFKWNFLYMDKYFLASTPVTNDDR